MLEYSWLTPIWRRLQQQITLGSLPHALLISGAPGVGKRYLAGLLGRYVQCSDRQIDGVCGVCKSCLLHAAHSHPDYVECLLEDGAKQIKVDAVRAVSRFAVQKSQQGGYKVIVIAPAEAMNESSANALLKSLEEPGDNTLIILVSDTVGRLLPTIRSRCQQLPIAQIDHESAMAWLAPQVDDQAQAKDLLSIVGNRPLAALALKQGASFDQRQQMLAELIALLESRSGIVIVAGKWAKFELSDTVYWLLDWLMDLARYSVDKSAAHNTDCVAVFELLSARMSHQQLHQQIQSLGVLRGAILSGATPNKQLTIEGALSSIMFQ